jgi:hypothetical protein
MAKELLCVVCPLHLALCEASECLISLNAHDSAGTEKLPGIT